MLAEAHLGMREGRPMITSVGGHVSQNVGSVAQHGVEAVMRGDDMR